jgi:CBS domain-containing protein
MRVAEIMTRDVEVVMPSDTIQVAAKLMDDLNVGSLPVCDGKKLVGMITDCDITVRAAAAGKAPDACQVEDIMTAEVEYVLQDEDIEAAAERMKARQIRRLPVIDGKSKRMVGILALGDLATDADREDVVAGAVEGISNPSKPDR